jgi:hypothetical protein
MSRFPNSFVSGSSAFIFFTAFLLFVTVEAAAPAGSTRITAAANVTLRVLPSPDAATVAQLPLGTEVSDAGPSGLDKKWIRVRLADNREGWLLSNLTRPLDPVWRWPTFDRIIAERLGRKGDGFTATVELVSFIERVAPEYTDPDGRGRIELARLRALSTAASLVPRTGGRRQPFAGWLDARKTDVIYDEPGGQWMLDSAMLWEAHARQSKTTSAEDIAWLAVTNGLAGECEGELACYLSAHNRLHGEYLRRHPLGKHAAEAVGALKQTLDAVGGPAKAGGTFMFDKKTDCRDLTAATNALASAVQATRVEGREAAVVNLAALKKICQ